MRFLVSSDLITSSLVLNQEDEDDDDEDEEDADWEGSSAASGAFTDSSYTPSDDALSPGASMPPSPAPGYYATAINPMGFEVGVAPALTSLMGQSPGGPMRGQEGGTQKASGMPMPGRYNSIANNSTLSPNLLATSPLGKCPLGQNHAVPALDLGGSVTAASPGTSTSDHQQPKAGLTVIGPGGSIVEQLPAEPPVVVPSREQVKHASQQQPALPADASLTASPPPIDGSNAAAAARDKKSALGMDQLQQSLKNVELDQANMASAQSVMR